MKTVIIYIFHHLILSFLNEGWWLNFKSDLLQILRFGFLETKMNRIP